MGYTHLIQYERYQIQRWLAVFDYIKAFYNRTRTHSALDFESPAQYEQRFNPLRYVP
jgi:transposase InsO family protein